MNRPGGILARYRGRVPEIVQGIGWFFLFGFVLLFVTFRGGQRSGVATTDFLVGFVVNGPFIAAVIYGGYWLGHSRLPIERYPRVGLWFFGGLAGFLLLNVVMILAWPAESLYDNLSWALFAASVGGAAGLGIGIFEGRAIERAVAAERNHLRSQQLREENERLEQFASIVSHDLRNPLSIARGRVELAREERDSDHLESVARALDRMDAIVEETLLLAQEGRIVDEIEPVDIDRIAGDCWEMVDTAEADLEVADTCTIDADRERLRHVFENLFRNAIEHAGDDVTVRVGTLDSGFYVEDTGPGLPPDERETVTESGTGETADSTGLGLTIVDRIAEAHGWETTVTSGTEGGARFEFTGVERAEADDPSIHTDD